MALNLAAKKEVVADISAAVKEANAVIIAEYRGLPVGTLTTMRVKARQTGVFLQVVKNTLMCRALAGTPFELLNEHITGPLIFGIGKDPVAVAKLFHEFAKENELMVIKGGAMPAFLLDASKVGTLALVPSRPVLLAKLAGTLQAPITVFVRTLGEIPVQLVRSLAAIREKKQGA